MKSGPKILFLPDFGQHVGGGHVMRCLTLSDALAVRGAHCAFAVRPEAWPVLAAFGAEVEIVETTWACDAAVVDGYDYTAGDEVELGRRVKTVIALDDLGRAHDCDLVIDAALGRRAADYPGRAKALVGPAFALVRPEFPATPWTPDAGRVLVSLGLTDVGGITERVVSEIMALKGWSKLDVVLGGAVASLPAMRALAAADPRVALHIDTPHMASLNARAAFVVGAGGTSVWERAGQGVPSLVLVLADNQAPGAAALAEAGAAICLGARAADFSARFSAAFDRLAMDAALRTAMGAKAHALCDGQGAARVAQEILSIASARDSAAV